MGFNGLNVVYDEEGLDYPVDNEGRIYFQLDPQTVCKAEDLENAGKRTKNQKDSVLKWALLVPQSVQPVQNSVKIYEVGGSCE